MIPAVLVVVFLVLLAAIVLVALVRSVAALWLDYKAKLILLEKLDQGPPASSTRELQLLLSRISTPTTALSRQDLTLTGTYLAGIGLGCFLTGKFLRVGQIAVGLYLGGVICIVLGFLIALLGALIRTTTRASRPDKTKE